MEDQEKRVEKHPDSNGSSDVTQVGQVIRNIATARRLPAPQTSARSVPTNSAQREQIATLIAALGDTNHTLHQQAVQELVLIGDPAVPALNEALNPRRPWLTSYRATEALGQIGDGRATGPLIETLRHPNSNVRWGAVRALAALSDARALLDLRRVAREDRGRTSWGESVAGAAQSALEQMQTQNVLLRGADLLKTAVACVLMLVALIIAWGTIETLRREMQNLGHEQVTNVVVSPLQTETTTDEASATAAALGAAPTVAPTETPAPAPTIAQDVTVANTVTGTALSPANVRSLPTRNGDRIGILTTGDEIVFIATTPDRTWYRIRLGDHHSRNSHIDSADGSGWVAGTLLSLPIGDLTVEEADSSTPVAQPTPGA